LPPAQDPDSFIALTNVEPVLQGILQRRRGYSLFSNQSPAVPYTLGYSYRSEALGLRETIWTSTGNVLVTSENGQVLLPTLFTPGANAFRPRMALSRSYGYFADGVLGDYKKFDGTQNPNNLTKWGIDINQVSATGVSGPNDATVAQDQGLGGTAASQGPLFPGTGTSATGAGSAWINPNNVGITGQVTTNAIAQFGTTNALQASNCGFSIPFGAIITGIQVVVTRSAQFATGITDAGVFLLQGGTAIGIDHSQGSPWRSLPTNITYGGATDLWGASWTASQINAGNFGVQLSATNSGASGAQTLSVYCPVQITIYYTIITGTSWANPNGSFQNNPSTPAFTTASVTASSDLRNTGFGLTPSLTGAIQGIQVTFSVLAAGGTVNLNPVLVQGGAVTGLRKTAPVFSTGSSFPSTNFAPITFGGPNDLWGGTWTPADINGSTTFGVQYNVSTASGSATFAIDRVQITVYSEAGPLTFTVNTATTNIVLLNGRTYFYAFQNSKTGHTSSISPPSLTTGPLTGNQVNLANIPTSLDTQVDTVLILATADGNDQTTLYLVAGLPNGTAAYNDTTPDALTASTPTGPALLTNSLYQDTDASGGLHGIANNDPPPAINFPLKHKGRIYGSIGQTLYFSKNLDDVTTADGLITAKFEEAWPAFYQMDISEFAETIQGLISDGETLWIGTERSIRRLVGDSPSNFSLPEIQFNEAGLLNQDCWKITFFEGQPVGTLWVTPDFRVMASDFNTYQDVGTPIQDILNAINVAAASTVHASYVSKGPADYYMLYLPTGTATSPNVVCVFDLRKKKWFIWSPTDSPTASAFIIDVLGNPRWFFATQAGALYEWTYGTFQDRIGNGPNFYPVTVQTAWMDLGDYSLRKFVNQIIPTTADNLALTIQVDAASNEQDFNNPLNVVPPTVVTPAAIPDDVFVPLASGPSHSRAFRFTFVSPPSAIQNILTGFSVEAGVVHRY
jgi:hypothetical protein